jgi:hypothetical protein
MGWVGMGMGMGIEMVWYGGRQAGGRADRQAGGRGRDCVLDLEWCGREGAVGEASARS